MRFCLQTTLSILLACQGAAASAVDAGPWCGPVAQLGATPVALAADPSDMPDACDPDDAAGWALDSGVLIWRCARVAPPPDSEEDGGGSHGLFVTRGNALLYAGPDVPNLSGADGLVVVQADLSGDGVAETIVSAHTAQSQGMGVNYWTVHVFDAAWDHLGSRTEVADWGPRAFVPRAPRRIGDVLVPQPGCAILLTHWREVEAPHGRTERHFVGTRADVGGDIPRFDTGAEDRLAARRYDRRFEARRLRDIEQTGGLHRDPVGWLEREIRTALQAESAP